MMKEIHERDGYKFVLIKQIFEYNIYEATYLGQYPHYAVITSDCKGIPQNYRKYRVLRRAIEFCKNKVKK